MGGGLFSFNWLISNGAFTLRLRTCMCVCVRALSRAPTLVCCVTTATCLTSLIVFRGNLRQKRGIPGSLVTDAGAMCLCCPCAWVQIAAEVAPPDIAGAPVESGDIKE